MLGPQTQQKDLDLYVKTFLPFSCFVLELTNIAAQANQNRFEKAKEDRRKAMQERNKQKKHVKTASQNKANNDQQLAALLTRQKWACVWMRNRHIKKAIRRDFAQRQKILARERRHRNEYDGSVDVIPVSATAFRDHLKDREPPGFPTVRHTGIPLLRRWLADSTLERREKHLDALLHALQRLFSSIQQWSLTNCGGQAIQFSRETVQDLLSRTHTKLVTVRHGLIFFKRKERQLR